ncbi:MAG: hypothetical protein M5R36_00510 [Deltaproteobacteria bacterium]|nr:hypothetical protein [Deltaproteobacteria bacterium]
MKLVLGRSHFIDIAIDDEAVFAEGWKSFLDLLVYLPSKSRFTSTCEFTVKIGIKTDDGVRHRVDYESSAVFGDGNDDVELGFFSMYSPRKKMKFLCLQGDYRARR